MNEKNHSKTVAIVLLALLTLCAGSVPAMAQQKYEKPPQAILDVLNAPLPPAVFLSPGRDKMLMTQTVRYPAIADLAEPMLALAGIRINPRTNAERSYIRYSTSLSMKRIPGGAETPVVLPASVRRIGQPLWNSSGTMFTFTNEADDCIELWLCDAETLAVRRVDGMRVNPLLSDTVHWLPDQMTLLVKTVPPERGAAPEPPLAPPGPKVQDSAGVTAASSTYEVCDVLKSPYDADLFDYYATSQLALVSAATGKVTPIGLPAVYFGISPAPGGGYLLVERIHRPFSYLRAYYRFPKDVEVWTTDGKLVETLVRLPLAESVPIDGVPTGARDHSWCPIEPATLLWIEALDNGDPKVKAPFRDRVMRRPLKDKAREFCRTEQRFGGMAWVEKGDKVLVSDYDPDRHWNRTFIYDARRPASKPRLLWDMSWDEKYKHPGYPVSRMLPSGAYALLQQGDWIYLDGDGFSPEGDRPFLDRLNLKTLKSERLFRCDRSCYEFFVAWVDPAAGRFITRRESPTEPANFFLRTLIKKEAKAAAPGESAWDTTSEVITSFPDPAPILRGIKKQLVIFTRDDGIPLSFMLYLPPDYKPGMRLPTVLWAYPIEYAEKGVAGQVEGSSQRFTTITGSSQLFFLLQGYAVLDNAAMPVIGPTETVYDTFPEQLMANAKAAITKAVELGVTDPERVGVAGHSHGALMTANLLVYSDLFRAGIARSGAFNHTLRPFGFQNEKRTLWKARDTYIKLSPVLQADKINEPLLLIHGELDQNPGTVTMQSEKLYEALRGLGATVRLCILPYESHGYIARESIEHVLFEMLSWFDRHVKNAPPRK
jgi:dipeptidyl aminopeptidase/acylaminoacyl peptidase